MTLPVDKEYFVKMVCNLDEEFHYSMSRHRDKAIIQSAKLNDVPSMKIREFWRHLPSIRNYLVHEQKCVSGA